MRIVSKQICDTVAARRADRKRRPVPRGQTGHGETGLTLVEMIVVLAIIAIVGAIIVTNVIDRPDQARVTVAKSDIKTISSALKMYRLDNGDYPTEQQGLDALVEKPTTPPVPQNWNPEGYLGDKPQDPWGHPYVYKVGPGGFTLMSLGKDGKPGGDGFDADIDGKQK